MLPKAMNRNKNTETEQNFNPGLTLIGLSGTGPWWIYYLLISLDEFGLGPPYHVDILRFFKLLFA